MSCPRSSSASTTCDPTKPAPPDQDSHFDNAQRMMAALNAERITVSYHLLGKQATSKADRKNIHRSIFISPSACLETAGGALPSMSRTFILARSKPFLRFLFGILQRAFVDN